MTLGAGECRKSIRDRPIAARRNLCLVALGAGNGHMASRQGEVRGLVLRQSESGRLEALCRMAVLALAVVGSSGKLTLVNIGVAILTGRLFYFEDRLDPGRHMALVAGHFRVFTHQRVACGCVLFHPKCGRLESLYSMASHTIPAVFSADELSSVRVLVTVKAPGELQRLFEVSTVMAINALHRCVLSKQRVFCFGVVKVRRHPGFGDPLPSGRRMARFAPRLECSMMRVRVAVATFAERDSHQLHHLWIDWLGLVAFRACHSGVLPSQWEACFGVVEMTDLFPVIKVVALLALIAHSALVWVLVTGDAIGR